MTRAEWERLAPRLSDEQKNRLRDDPGATPVTCPLLEKGVCSVYEVRPIACRTYGFYTERDAGLHCALVARAVADTPVIWGNGEAIAADLREHGPEKSIADWLREELRASRACSRSPDEER